MSGRRVLLVLPSSTYRAPDFLRAARALGVEVLVASEEPQAMAETMGDRFVLIDLCDARGSAAALAEQGIDVDAVIGVDEAAVLFASHLASALGLRTNPPRAVATTRDKALTRIVLTDAGLDQPAHRLVTPEEDPAAASVGYPCVVKPLNLAASRGVIRADDADAVRHAAQRVRAIAGDPEAPVLVEQYVPGAEVAVEGLLCEGRLEVLAIFDKPDPLEGPYFEETIYVTPSRHPEQVQSAATSALARACSAIGLVEGPVHGELRIPDGRPVVLEVAARSIGGLCSRVLRFGVGISLEELILRHALRLELGDLRLARPAAGVMMLPVSRSGRLVRVGGLEEARSTPLVEGVEITIPAGGELRAWPEGDRYLGFVFASGPSPEAVEEALRRAHAALDVVVEGDGD